MVHYASDEEHHGERSGAVQLHGPGFDWMYGWAEFTSAAQEVMSSEPQHAAGRECNNGRVKGVAMPAFHAQIDMGGGSGAVVTLLHDLEDKCAGLILLECAVPDVAAEGNYFGEGVGHHA